MTARVAFATATPEVLGSADSDRPLHERACAAAGIALEHPVWSDPAVDWAAFDLVVVRSTWDYLDHLDEFRTWLTAVDRVAPLANPASVIGWNLDKGYLADLAAAGIPVVPTRICADADEVEDALGSASGEVVVKPVVSAGSRRTGRFERGDPAAAELAGLILSGGTRVLVQPAVASVAIDGEVGTLVFGGVISHSVRKGPLLARGGGLLAGDYRERLTPEPLTGARRDLVRATSATVSDVVAARFGVDHPLLYARVDLVGLDDGTEAVLEVELAEPSFFLATCPEGAPRFAEAVTAALAGRRGRPPAG